MKKTLILFLFIAGAMGSNAQIKKMIQVDWLNRLLRLRLKDKSLRPHRSKRILRQLQMFQWFRRSKLQQACYTHPSTTTQTPNQPTQPTTTANSTTTPVALADMVITNISFFPNTGNTYAVNYTLKNVGTAAVKKGLLSVQGYINGGPWEVAILPA